MDVLELPTTMKTIQRWEAGGYIGYSVIKSQLTTFEPHYPRCRSIKGSCYTWVIDVDAVIPLSGEYKSNSYYYVRDNLVDSYKADSRWSSVTNRILPMSELPTS